MTDEADGVRLLSPSRRKTKIDRKTRNWVQHHIYKKEQVADDAFCELATDAFGEVDFKGATRKAKAKFVRFSDATSPGVLFNLLTKHWHVEKPRLLISVTGGAKSFNLDPKLKQIFSSGLRKVAQTPGAWVLTGGTNTGVMQYVGEALQGITVACVGISTWGIITNKENLQCSAQDDDLGGKFSYNISCSLVEKGAYLDHNHTHHLMVDDGSDGKFGAEISFRSLFEKHVMESAVGGVPAVLLVVQGGVGTMDTIWSAISDDSPIFIVIVKNSGRAADVFSYAYNCIEDSNEYDESKSYHVGLLGLMRKSFPELDEDAQKDYCRKVHFCMKRRDSFTIFQVGGDAEFDEVILMALLRHKKCSPFAQLQLTLLWDRADLARGKILSKPLHWERCDLEYSMVMALAMDRVDFVKLLLEYGISIASLLTNDLLEFLYGFASLSPASTLKSEFDEKDYVGCNMFKYSDVVHLLCSYEGFNPRKCAIPRRIIQNILVVLCKNLMVQGERDFIENLNPEFNYMENVGFAFPYKELFFWAVLNNKQKMALYLWEFEEEAMSKALIAAEINTALFKHSQKHDLPDDLVKSYANNANEFKELALNVLDECSRENDLRTRTLITCEFSQFAKQTSLGIAVNSRDLDFVSHSSVQMWLNEKWTGTIIMRDVADLQLMLAFIFPPLINTLEFNFEAETDAMISVDDDNDDSDNDVVEEKRSNGNAVEVRNENGTKKETLNSLVHADIKYRSYESFAVKEERRSRKKTSTSFCKKFHEFYFKTSVTKFYAGVLSYFVFLLLFAYVSMLKKNDTTPTKAEIALIVYVCSLTIAEIHQISQGDGHSLKVKLREWADSQWNILDACAITLFFIALALRLHVGTIHIGHLMYAIDGGFWVLRLLKVFYVHRVFGPYVVMIFRMTKDTMYFLVIFLVFLISYGVSSKAVLVPQDEGENLMEMVRNILFHPYFNIYGEFFIDRDPIDNKTTRFGTPVTDSLAEPMAWCLLAMYLFITNILLMNLLIAVFNNTFNSVQENSEKIWKFERYDLVLEYAQRAPVAAPFSLFVHVYLFIRYVLRKCSGCVKNGEGIISLKSSVSDEEKDELIEFENNCVASYVRKREALLETSLEKASVEIMAELECVKASLCSIEERFDKMEELMG